MLRFSTLFLCVLATHASPLERKTPLGSRIFNGEAATLGQFPWQAGLILRGPRGDYFCGGTIIAADWILTAGYCVDEADRAEVFTGLIDLNAPDRKESRSIEIIQHENFSLDYFQSDIALIRLEVPLEFDENTSAISLADVEVEDNVEVILSGWGAIAEDGVDTSVGLNFARLNSINSTECRAVYGESFIYDGILCANSGTEEARGPCVGDMGDPLVADFESAPTLVGIAIFTSTSGCDSNDPSGYTRVPFYRQWIEEKMLGPPTTVTTDGTTESTAIDTTVGTTEGTTESPTEGTTEGTTGGTTEGTTEGPTEGTTEGPTEGTTEGPTEGTTEGPTEGPTEGTTDITIEPTAES